MSEVLLVIDLQQGMFDGVAEPPLDQAGALLSRVQDVIAWARRSGRKVAFIQHHGPAGDTFAPDSPGWPVLPALGQAADEPTFSKTVGDAFSNPALGAWIAAAGARGVILTGAQSDYCVNATVGGALAKGLAVTVVGDAHGTVSTDAKPAPAIIARHNADFAARGARVVSAAELVGR